MERQMTRIKKIISPLLFTAMTMAVSASFAAVPVPFGWYLEGNVGLTQVSNTNYGSNTATSSSGAAWNVNGGYKFSPFFGGEVGYTRYAATKIKTSGGSGYGAKDNHYAIDIAGKGILPIGDTGAEFFAKIGASWIQSRVSITNTTAAQSLTGLQTGNNNATNLYLGFGGEYAVTPNMPISLQWARSKGNNTTGALDLYSLGVAYIFG
jgi:hypothetical protein